MSDDKHVIAEMNQRAIEHVYKGHRDQRWGPTSYAQHGDDYMLLNLIELVVGPIPLAAPTWLDLGAHDPVTLSNTYLLYRMGMCGINVEANPHLITELRRQRPRDKSVLVGVGLKDQTDGLFYMYSDTHGRNTFSAAEVDANEKLNMSVREMIRLPMRTIDSIVNEECNGIYPPVLSVDIEGLDYDVLAMADFSKSAPFIICVETRRHDTQRMAEMLAGKGYALYCRMAENLFFVHTDVIAKAF